MTRLATLLPVWAIVVTIVVLALDAVSRRWRRYDGALWHQVWVACILATASGAVVTAVVTTSVTVPLAALPAWAGPDGAPAIWLRRASAAWMAGAGAISGLLLLRLLAGWTRVRRLARMAQPAFGPQAARWVRAAAPEADWSLAEFRDHRRVRTPVTIGWRRPLILLPEAWTMWPADRLGVIVRHELAHVARRDYLWNLIAAAAEAVFWFVPGVWIAARRVRLCAELAADHAASAPVGRIVYARHLVETAAALEVRRRFPGLSVALGVATDLRRRVDCLLDDHERPPAAGRLARAFVVLAAVVLVIGAMVLRAAPAAPQHSPVDHAQIHALKHQH